MNDSFASSQDFEEDPEKEPVRIVFARKHHWKHSKHNNTIVSEKRWRTSEKFGVDKAFYSPLSSEQYTRRKTVGAAILKSLGDFESLDDMVIDGLGEADLKVHGELKMNTKRKSTLY
jgi:hypothetical protein